MKHFCRLIISLMISVQVFPVVFKGLQEDSSVTKNTFFCPLEAAGSTDCSNADVNAIGYVLTEQQPLQLFNNQSYWLRRQAEQEKNYQINQRLSGAELSTKMQNEGWIAMGGYCILVSTNHNLTDVVMPKLVASGSQVKVVVQLWYNGENNVQLWSQDAALIDKNQGFYVQIFSTLDDQISQLPKLSDEKTFLGKIGLQINNRAVQYGKANNSPRSVKIKAA